jgi:hypothetical protein
LEVFPWHSSFPSGGQVRDSIPPVKVKPEKAVDQRETSVICSTHMNRTENLRLSLIALLLGRAAVGV